MNRTWLISGGVSVLFVALVGAVFLGAQLAGSQSNASTSETVPAVAANVGSVDDGNRGARAPNARDDEPEKASEKAPEKKGGAPARVMELVHDDGSGPVSVRITVEPSPDLPDRPSEASGVFVSRDDNSIMVGTGGVELDVEVRQTKGGTLEPQVSLSHTGPEVEVVVTHDTILYREETEMPSPDKSGDKTVQQVVTPVDSLDELGKNTELQVWGRKTGDRVVAQVLVYRIVTVDLPF